MFPLENASKHFTSSSSSSSSSLQLLCLLLIAIPLMLNELITTINCIKLVEIKVPSKVIKGSDVELKCLYDLEGDSLYALKWHFNGREFYRYAPNSNQNVIIFNVTGTKVNKNKSHQGNIILSNVGVNSTGRYKCELTAGVTFQTVHKENYMRVSANSANSLWASSLSSSSFSSSSWLTVGSFLLMLIKVFPTLATTIALTSISSQLL